MKPALLILFTTASLARIPAIAQDTPRRTRPRSSSPARSSSTATQLPTSFAIFPSARFPICRPPYNSSSTTAAASFRKPTKRTAQKMSSTPASSAPAPLTGPSSAPRRERSLCWSSLAIGSSQPFTLASAPETERLQTHDPSGVLGFNWGIDPASPEQVHDAQLPMRHPPPRLDHDALADTLVDRHTVYHFYLKSAWIVLEMQD